jgi:GTP-binding protein
MGIALGNVTEFRQNQWRPPGIYKRFDTRFVGSFFDMGQLPADRRPQIAVAGRSNVGKSSLLNQLLSQKKLA